MSPSEPEIRIVLVTAPEPETAGRIARTLVEERLAACVNVLPGIRSSVTAGDGSYSLPALPPGDYTVTFTLQGMQTVNKQTPVVLGNDATVDAKLSVQAVSESVTVSGKATFVDKTSATIGPVRRACTS